MFCKKENSISVSGFLGQIFCIFQIFFDMIYDMKAW
jgi:hypothetical protein